MPYGLFTGVRVANRPPEPSISYPATPVPAIVRTRTSCAKAGRGRTAAVAAVAVAIPRVRKKSRREESYMCSLGVGAESTRA